MRLQHVIVDVAALEELAEHMAHLLAHAKQADRATFGGFVAAHQVNLGSAARKLKPVSEVIIIPSAGQ
jgi:hypothetical protein